ncbi:hypothetical protein PINS_up004856 [Pythium insidiosum]|nr:hypothetical protein PINS_up004856 [Pythium insidiosum]
MRSDGVVLFDEQQNGGGTRRSSLTASGLMSPALFLGDRPQPPIKLKGAKDVATTSGTNGDGVFFISPGGDTPMMYPDDGEDSRPLAFFRRTTTQILICVALGVGLGVLLSNLRVSKDVSALVNLPGAIFLRVLRCFVLPMVFCSLATGAANIVLLGKVSAVGMRTALYFLACSTFAAVLSLLVALTLRASLQIDHHKRSVLPEKKAFLHVACGAGAFLEQHNDSTLACSASAMSATTRFQLVDLAGAVLNNRPLKTVSLQQQITDILAAVLPVNIFRSFQDGVLMSVIMFAVAFGAAAIRVSSQQSSPLLEVLNQMNKIFFFRDLQAHRLEPAGRALAHRRLAVQPAVADRRREPRRHARAHAAGRGRDPGARVLPVLALGHDAPQPAPVHAADAAVRLLRVRQRVVARDTAHHAALRRVDAPGLAQPLALCRHDRLHGAHERHRHDVPERDGVSRGVVRKSGRHRVDRGRAHRRRRGAELRSASRRSRTAASSWCTRSGPRCFRTTTCPSRSATSSRSTGTSTASTRCATSSETRTSRGSSPSRSTRRSRAHELLPRVLWSCWIDGYMFPINIYSQ